MPYWRLSGFYFFYFASLGALVFYWNPYLKSLGFADSEIGELMAIIMATRIIAPNVWGYLADRTGRRMTVVRLGSLLCVLSFIGIFFGHSYWWLFWVMMCFSFFWNASLPQFEATTLNHLGENTERYNHIRLWGSIGFIVVVMGLGIWLDVQNGSVLAPNQALAAVAGEKYRYLPWVLCALLGLIFLYSLVVPDNQIDLEQYERGPLLSTLRQPRVLWLLAVVCLLQASHGPYYVYFVRYMNLYLHTQWLIGLLISIGVFAEILIFLIMRPLLIRWGHRRLILVALSLASLRWFLTARYPQILPLMIAVQTLHAASFGIMHVVCIDLIHRYFVGSHQGRGQALFSSVSFGLGGVIGSLYSGYLWQTWGEATRGSVIYYVATGMSVLALIAAWIGIEKRTPAHVAAAH